MKNYDQSIEINYNPNWPYISDHLYRILIIGGFGSGKTNVLLNLLKHQQPDICRRSKKVLFTAWIRSFSLKTSSLNVTKSAGGYRCGHIYWQNP